MLDEAGKEIWEVMRKEQPSQFPRKQVRLNLGGEGERAGYIDVNPLQGNRIPKEKIIARNPTGEFVEAGAENLPFADNSVDEIISNNLPSFIFHEHGESIFSEIIRVLKPGATAKIIHRNISTTNSFGEYLSRKGFLVENGYATFTKK